MKSLSNIHWHIVDMILHGVALEVGLKLLHFLAIGIGHFRRGEAQGTSRFKVDKAMGACAIVELKLMGAMKGVEKDDFVLVMT